MFARLTAILQTSALMDRPPRFSTRAEYDAWKASTQADAPSSHTAPIQDPTASADGEELAPEIHTRHAHPVSQSDERVLGTTASRTAPARFSRTWNLLTLVFVIIVLTVATANYMFVERPVTQALRADARNSGYSLHAYYSHFVDRRILILDLTDVTTAAPVDLFRGLFQAANVLQARGSQFERVVLARSGTHVYVMQGNDFRSMGVAFAAGQNLVYLIRTLPEKLRTPEGGDAFAR